MRRSRSELIESLAGGLSPGRPGGRTFGPLLAWLLVSWTFVIAATLWTAPLRPDVDAQLLEVPRFALETLLGGVVGVALAASAVALGIPGPGAAWRRLAPALILSLLWVAAYGVGLYAPSLAPSMLGKRDACSIEVILYGTPPLLLGLWMLRRLAPLQRVRTGLVVGLAAGALPGLLMQLACMYLVDHILIHHIGPIAVVAVLGAALGPLLLRRI